jgi:translation initiation factor IF-2
MEDHAMPAQCIIIESNIEERGGMTTATVLVKKGLLQANDTFVCGLFEGKVRNMKDDNGRNIKEAFPGQAVHLEGFKQFPEVGNPLYVV